MNISHTIYMTREEVEETMPKIQALADSRDFPINILRSLQAANGINHAMLLDGMTQLEPLQAPDEREAVRGLQDI